jgi:hypothetical protein
MVDAHNVAESGGPVTTTLESVLDPTLLDAIAQAYAKKCAEIVGDEKS